LFEIIVAMSSGRADEFANIRFVFLDRDGVLNRKAVGGYVTSWEQVKMLPGAEEAVARLNRSGRKAIIVTNQRGIARGIFSESDLHALHDSLRQHLAAHGAHLDGIYYCPHESGQCLCRKPQPGLFEQAFRDFPDAAAANSVMVGDSLCDIEAASGLGMRSILLADPEETQSPETVRAAALATASAGSLLEFVERYLG
jgi:D-glycero-D-manno-heptose 1,7-bisphosphate phosphatase